MPGQEGIVSIYTSEAATHGLALSNEAVACVYVTMIHVEGSTAYATVIGGDYAML